MFALVEEDGWCPLCGNKSNGIKEYWLHFILKHDYLKSVEFSPFNMNSHLDWKDRVSQVTFRGKR